MKILRISIISISLVAVFFGILILSVMMYPNGTGFTNGGAATIVLGQSSFTPGTTATTLNVPFGLAFDSSGNLWVADHYNNRVLKYTAMTSWLEILHSLLR
jgi:NHL repeat